MSHHRAGASYPGVVLESVEHLHLTLFFPSSVPLLWGDRAGGHPKCKYDMASPY